MFSAQVAQGERFKVVPVMEELKKKARAQGLWNLFLPDSERGGGLTNVEYAPIAEITGYYPNALGGDELFRAGHHGNMEVFERFGTPEPQRSGSERFCSLAEIRSAFCMTEAGRGLVRRHQHSSAHRAGWRFLRH